MSTTAAREPIAVEADDTDDAGPRKFVPGTIGWTADDLDDPRIERAWLSGCYEIVEGVLTYMAAAHFDGGGALVELITIVKSHLRQQGIGGKFAVEADVVLNQMRVPRVDAVYLSADLLRQQQALNAASRRPRGKYGRVRVPPTLAVESVSPGHEAHDRKTKRRWYAEAGVPHYWLVDAFAKSLECLVLEGSAYRTEQLGHGADEVKPSLFPGLVIRLAELWE